jgi:S-adenosylmethionine decarboxylase
LKEKKKKTWGKTHFSLVGMFGSHITLDLSGCSEEKLRNLQLHFDILNDLPEKIGMTKITQPYVFPYSGIVPEDKGITGIVIIAESHISIHSFQEKKYCFVDIFSCKPFDTRMAIDYIVDAVEPTYYKTNIVERGLDFPR